MFLRETTHGLRELVFSSSTFVSFQIQTSLFLFSVFEYFVCMYACALCGCLVLPEARRGEGFAWNWHY